MVQFVWSLRYIDAPILRDNETLYALSDANQNVTALVDGTTGSGTFGEVVERYEYDPYGNVTVMDGAWGARPGGSLYESTILFAGYWRDSETGLYHVRHRMYHVRLGRWLQRDPEGYVDGMSLYEYVTCNPACLYDSLGLLHDRNIAGDRILRDGSVARWDEADVDQAKREVVGALSGDPIGRRTLEVLDRSEVYAFESFTDIVREYEDGARTRPLPHDDSIVIAPDAPPVPDHAVVDGVPIELEGAIRTGAEWPAGGYHRGEKIGLQVRPEGDAQKMASVLVHEAEHDLTGPDEIGAHEVQDRWLASKGKPPVRESFRNTDGTTSVTAIREYVSAAYRPKEREFRIVEGLRGPISNWKPQGRRNLRGDVIEPSAR